MILDSLISSFLGGGLTGIVGTIAQRVFEYKTKKLELEAANERYAHEIEMRKADSAILAQEWAARTRMTEVTETGKAEVADAKAFNTALTSEPKRYAEGPLSPKQTWLMVTLDFIRGIIRPGLTLYLCALTTVMYVQAHRLINGIGIMEAYSLVERITSTLLYLFTTCTLFYFGTRNRSKGN